MMFQKKCFDIFYSFLVLSVRLLINPKIPPKKKKKNNQHKNVPEATNFGAGRKHRQYEYKYYFIRYNEAKRARNDASEKMGTR